MKPGFTRGRKRKKGTGVDSTGRLDRSETSQVIRIAVSFESPRRLHTHRKEERREGGEMERRRKKTSLEHVPHTGCTYAAPYREASKRNCI